MDVGCCEVVISECSGPKGIKRLYFGLMELLSFCGASIKDAVLVRGGACTTSAVRNQLQIKLSVRLQRTCVAFQGDPTVLFFYFLIALRRTASGHILTSHRFGYTWKYLSNSPRGGSE